MSDLNLSNVILEELKEDIVNALARIEVGKVDSELLYSIISRIDKLNDQIDLMHGPKSFDDYIILDLCYQMYRIRDKIEAIKFKMR